RNVIGRWTKSCSVPSDAGDAGGPTGEVLENLDREEGIRLNREDRDREDLRTGGLHVLGPQSLLLSFELGPRLLRVEENRKALMAAGAADVRAAVAVDPRDRSHHEELRVDAAAPASAAGREVVRSEPARHRGTSVDADDLYAFADPIRRQIDAAGTPALGDDLLDHLLTENVDLGLLAGARHAVTPPARIGGVDGEGLREDDDLGATTPRGTNQPGTPVSGPDDGAVHAEGSVGILLRTVRPRDARPLARQVRHRRVRAGRRIPERVEDRQLLHPAEQVAADGTGGNQARPRAHP